MSKFEKVYPDMERIVDERHNIIRAEEPRTCCICGDLTEFVEINYEAHICSEECLKQMDELYSQTEKATAPHSDKSYWDYDPKFKNWSCHACHWTIGEELFGSHPDNKGYKFCPYCGVEMTEPVMGIVYKGD